MDVENLFGCLNNFAMTRLIQVWNIRRRNQPTEETLPIQDLMVRKRLELNFTRCEKSSNVLRGDPSMTHILIVRSHFLEQGVIRPINRRRLFRPFIPEERRQATRPQNANELRFRFCSIEPVKCLGARNQIDRSIGQCGGLRRAANTTKGWTAA